MVEERQEVRRRVRCGVGGGGGQQKGGMRETEIRSTVWEVIQTRDVRALPSSPKHLSHHGTRWVLVLK